MRDRDSMSHIDTGGAAHVHNDLAGALHDVGVVERALVALSLDPSRAGLGNSVIFCPFPTRASRAWRLAPRFSVRGGAPWRLARLAGRSVRRSVRRASV